MLRVEASNLTSARTTPRSRRLHANSTAARRATSRHEILPPRDDASPATEQLLVPPAPPPVPSDRWSVRLELIEDEVARLYSQGLARGALVWKKGMAEWRPLLSTSELMSLLRKTRLALTESSSPPLPAAARVPSDIMLSSDESGRRVPLTVSPIAMDIAPAAPASPRRRYEVVGAAAFGFVLAWLTFSGATPSSPNVPPSLSVAAAAAPPAPAPPPVQQPTAQSNIPLVALSDLPVLGAPAAGAAASGSPRGHRSAAASGAGPSRADLIGALGRVAGAAGGCGERGGAVRVVISFAPSGVARSIQVSGKDLPSQTRSCIIGAASRARVPAFSGDPVTVSKTL
jgi:hypothetical protein